MYSSKLQACKTLARDLKPSMDGNGRADSNACAHTVNHSSNAHRTSTIVPVLLQVRADARRQYAYRCLMRGRQRDDNFKMAVEMGSK